MFIKDTNFLKGKASMGGRQQRSAGNDTKQDERSPWWWTLGGAFLVSGFVLSVELGIAMASADFGKLMILPLAAACAAAYAWRSTRTTAQTETLIQQRPA